MNTNNQNITVLEKLAQHQICSCGSIDFFTYFANTWKRNDAEIFECRVCHKTYTEETSEQTGKKIFVRQKSFPK